LLQQPKRKDGKTMKQTRDDHVSMIEKETNRRIAIYYDYAPGTPECKVPPFTFKHAWHSIYLTLFLIGLFAWAAVSVFPSYFHG
jgi:hypothetical protein